MNTQLEDGSHEASAPRPVFERTESLLREAGHEIVHSSKEQSFIETRNALYAIVEGSDFDALRVRTQFANAMLKLKKNFALHAPNLAETPFIEFGAMGFLEIAVKLKQRALLCASEMQVARSIDELERPGKRGFRA